MKMPIYITSNNTYIRKKDNHLVIDNQGRKIPCPTEGVSYIVKYGNSQVTEQLLNYLADKKIIMFRFSYGGKYCGMFLPPEHNIGKSRLKQYEAYFDTDKRMYIAKSFVEAGTRNKLQVLRKYSYRNKDSRLKAIIISIKSYSKTIQGASNVDSLRGIEGNIARHYFEGIGICVKGKGFDFNGRNYNPPRDEFNALLSFGYSLLYAEILSKLHEHGLCVFLGFLHEQNNGQNALVYDLSEVFKQVMVDSLVISLVNNCELKKFHFNRKPDGACLLSTQGKNFFIKKWLALLRKTVPRDEGIVISYLELVREEVVGLKRFLEGDVESYIGYRL